MFKKIIEKRFYRHFDTQLVNKAYKIENYITPHLEPFRVMRKHKQGFKIKFLFFTKIVWYTSRIELMEFPRLILDQLDNMDVIKTSTNKFKLPIYKEMKLSLFKPLLFDGTFTIAKAYYGKKYDNEDVKIFEVEFIDQDIKPIVDINAITLTKEVLIELLDMHNKLKEVEKHIKEDE